MGDTESVPVALVICVPFTYGVSVTGLLPLTHSFIVLVSPTPEISVVVSSVPMVVCAPSKIFLVLQPVPLLISNRYIVLVVVSILTATDEFALTMETTLSTPSEQ